MASITIRNLDDGVKTRLRIRAAEHGRSMEEEARVILRMRSRRRPARTTSPAPSARASPPSMGWTWSSRLESPCESRSAFD